MLDGLEYGVMLAMVILDLSVITASFRVVGVDYCFNAFAKFFPIKSRFNTVMPERRNLGGYKKFGSI